MNCSPHALTNTKNRFFLPITTGFAYLLVTGKFLSEALIFASTNPQYDNHENSKLKPGENMLCTEIVSDIQNNFRTQHVLPMFCKKKSFWQRFTCTSQKNTDYLRVFRSKIFGQIICCLDLRWLAYESTKIRLIFKI